MKAVIMAGGHGTRLWPLSTQVKPKQFQPIMGKLTMIQTTFERLNFLPASSIYISTNAQYKDLVLEQLPQIPKENIIIEPMRRDTGPAMAFATHFLAKQGFTDEVVSFVSSDHYIKEVDQFQAKLQIAVKVAKEKRGISIVEVKAKNPDTNLGYVKLGKFAFEIDEQPIYKLDSFIEKPDLETAIKYTNAHDYLWNTGIYTWHIQSFLDLLQKYTPEIAEPLNQITDHYDCSEIFAKFPTISIDYGLMEKLKDEDVYIVPADFAWSDVGNWSTVYEQLQNAGLPLAKGNVIESDSSNNLIYANKDQTIVTIGMKDFVVINHKNHLLICPRDKASNIKNVLKENNLC